MSNQAISAAVHSLKQEHIRLCKELERVDQALSALGGLEPAKSTTVKRGGRKSFAAKTKRKVSAAARKKMSEAARARWAARRKEKAA